MNKMQPNQAQFPHLSDSGDLGHGAHFIGGCED